MSLNAELVNSMLDEVISLRGSEKIPVVHSDRCGHIHYKIQTLETSSGTTPLLVLSDATFEQLPSVKTADPSTVQRVMQTLPNKKTLPIHAYALHVGKRFLL